MQKKLIVAAVAGALAAPLAFAQSNVTIYGIVDVGVESGNYGAGSQFRVQSGQASGSRLGFKGTEDLGGGLKANFTLETGFALDSAEFTAHSTNRAAGTGNQGATNTQVFARQAWAGLSGNFGSVNFGRQYTPIFWVAITADPVSAGTVATPFNLYGFTNRFDNSVIYKTPTMGGFDASVGYSTGNEVNTTTANEKAGRAWSVNGQWTGGPAYAGVGYEERRGANLTSATSANPGTFDLTTGVWTAPTTATSPNADKTKNWVLGGSYDFGVAKLFAAWNDIEQDPVGGGTKLIDARVWSLGATIKAGPGSVSVTFADRNDKLAANSDARLFGVGYNYPLSKRTDIYAYYARLTNKNNGTAAGDLTLNSATATGFAVATTDYDPRAFQLGLRHTF